MYIYIYLYNRCFGNARIYTLRQSSMAMEIPPFTSMIFQEINYSVRGVPSQPHLIKDDTGDKSIDYPIKIH